MTAADKNCANDFDGWPFVVTIDRSQMERRYVLKTINNQDGSITERNDPMTAEEFRKHYGFSETFPHQWLEQNKVAQKCPVCNGRKLLDVGDDGAPDVPCYACQTRT